MKPPIRLPPNMVECLQVGWAGLSSQSCNASLWPLFWAWLLQLLWPLLHGQKAGGPHYSRVQLEYMVGVSIPYSFQIRVTIRPERHCMTCNWWAVPWLHHADSATTVLISCTTTSPVQGCCPGLPVSIQQCPTYLADECQLIAASAPLHWHGNVCCATVTLPSAISVLQPLDHACGTRCPLNYDNESTNGCCKTHLFRDCSTLWHF